jgi:hypothetical protein
VWWLCASLDTKYWLPYLGGLHRTEWRLEHSPNLVTKKESRFANRLLKATSAKPCFYDFSITLSTNTTHETVEGLCYVSALERRHYWVEEWSKRCARGHLECAGGRRFQQCQASHQHRPLNSKLKTNLTTRRVANPVNPLAVAKMFRKSRSMSTVVC